MRIRQRTLSMLMLLVFMFTTMFGAFTVTASAAAKVKMSKASVTIAVGETYELQLLNSSGTVKWSTDKKSVATVKNGKVTAKKTGTATITAKYKSKSYTCTVNVVKYRVYGKKTSLTVGKSMQLSVKGKVGSKTVKWSSSDNSVLKVDQKGKVTAVGVGTAKIYAMIDGQRYYKTIKGKCAVPDDGEVLNIWCWNDEFQQLVVNYYPDYVELTDEIGMIGDVVVYWYIQPDFDGDYQQYIDTMLTYGDDAFEKDDLIDIFLVEADYADKYLNSDYVLPVREIGITKKYTDDMYDYTKQIGSDDDGLLKAVSWQAAPGVFAYRRDIAKKVLGYDDPDKVAKAISTWDKFTSVASRMKKQGYCMTSSHDELLRVFMNSADAPLVKRNTITLNDEVMDWIEMCKLYADTGYSACAEIWSEEWMSGTNENVFGYFYPTWGVNFTLPGSAYDTYGDWAVCEAPEPYYWGGSWLCAASTTDNASLVADIMQTLCCDMTVMYSISTGEERDFSNNASANAVAARGKSGDKFLGGQNSFKVFNSVAEDIKLPDSTIYDADIMTALQICFADYFEGIIDFDEALDSFYEMVISQHPNLRRPSVLPKEP